MKISNIIAKINNPKILISLKEYLKNSCYSEKITYGTIILALLISIKYESKNLDLDKSYLKDNLDFNSMSLFDKKIVYKNFTLKTPEEPTTPENNANYIILQEEDRMEFFKESNEDNELYLEDFKHHNQFKEELATTPIETETPEEPTSNETETNLETPNATEEVQPDFEPNLTLTNNQDEPYISNNEDSNELGLVSSIIDDAYMAKMIEVGFLDMTIEEQHNYIINTYNVNYRDLIEAITYHPGLSFYHTNIAEEILSRPDFDEIKAFFTILTDNKINYVLQRRNETYDRFKVVMQIVAGEEGISNYSEGYVVMNSVDNRAHGTKWSGYINALYGNDRGYSLYGQMTASGQYDVYLTGKYMEYPNIRQYTTFYGALDYLVLEVSIHNFPSFRDSSIYFGPQLVKYGDHYGDEQDPSTFFENPTLQDIGYVNFETEINLLSGDILVSRDGIYNINEEEKLELTK